MELITPQPTAKAPSDWFTGDVWLDPVFPGREPSRLRANTVRFSPGARTHWHHHTIGQTLHILTGLALFGTRDGVVIEARPGETVWFSPGEEHWHAAAPDRFMAHLAMQETESLEESETTWLEPVTDEQYGAPRTRP